MANQRELNVHTEMARAAQDIAVKESFKLLQKHPRFTRLSGEMWGMQSAILRDQGANFSQVIESNIVTSSVVLPTTKLPAWIDSLTMQSKYLIEKGKVASLFIGENRWIIQDIPHGLLLFLYKIPQAYEEKLLGQYLQSLGIENAKKVGVDTKGTIFLRNKPLNFLGSITFPDTGIHREHTSYVYGAEYNQPPQKGTRAINPPYFSSKAPLLSF